MGSLHYQAARKMEYELHTGDPWGNEIGLVAPSKSDQIISAGEMNRRIPLS